MKMLTAQTRLVLLLGLFVVVLAVQVPLASATVTYVVGTCKKANNPITSITQALQTTPRPNIVEVCPGNYAEQVVITFPVTVEGISDGSSADALIGPPAGGMVANATNDLGVPMAAQVWVDNAGGDVNLTNLEVNGGGAVLPAAFFVGVFYQNSPGTMNHIVTANHTGNELGVGVWLEGGSRKPTVILENSFIVNVDSTAVAAETNSTNSELNATIKENSINPIEQNSGALYGITLLGGLTATVSDNLITAGATPEGATAIWIQSGSDGTISKNTIDGYNVNGIGIILESDTMSVTGNTIEGGGSGTGIKVTSSVAPVTDNTIRFGAAGIDFGCVAGSNVHSNTLMEDIVGLGNVPTSAVSANTYYSVLLPRSGGC